jgi:hypothetical protein
MAFSSTVVKSERHFRSTQSDRSGIKNQLFAKSELSTPHTMPYFQFPALADKLFGIVPVNTQETRKFDNISCALGGSVMVSELIELSR